MTINTQEWTRLHLHAGRAIQYGTQRLDIYVYDIQKIIRHKK